MTEKSKNFFSKMDTVLSINIDGVDLNDRKKVEEINSLVEKKVKGYVEKLKSSHTKFIDEDFGPDGGDKYGAKSLYGTAMPAPAGSKYPRPDDLRWDRPVYDDNYFTSETAEADGEEGDEGAEDDIDEFEDDFGGASSFEDAGEDEVWCKHGSLFLDGTSSGDVIQGQLGDCWFLGALAVMGAHESLLHQCFWKADSFKNYGLFVIRFFKGCEVIFVIIDDRIPVKQRDGKIIFAACKDPNELWVPLVEKAYAKLHGCYKALIGGYSHNALSDMTGFAPKLMVLKPGFTGYSESLDKEEVWSMLTRYKDWNCLMGTSIQSNPKANQKVEAEAGLGLHMGHAYSFLGLDTIKDPKRAGGEVRLVKLRNPWGRGEWEGAYGDRSEEREREEINKELEKFRSAHEDIEVNFMDGTFFMPYEDWIERFTSLFVAINFPSSWTGKRTSGFWAGESGGNREMGSWISNPKVKVGIKGKRGEFKRVFVGIYTHDSRLTLGFDYYKDPLYSTPLAFDIITADEFELPHGKRTYIPRSRKAEAKSGDLGATCTPEAMAHKAPAGEKPTFTDLLAKQAPYNFGSTQIECYLEAGTDYYIVPFLYKRTQKGDYYVNVYCEEDFDLEGGAKLPSETELMTVGTAPAAAADALEEPVKTEKPVEEGSAQGPHSAEAAVAAASPTESGQEGRSMSLRISKAQFFEKTELLRDRFVNEAKKLGVSQAALRNVFISDKASDGTVKGLTYPEFKRRLMDLKFSLTDIPDEDLLVLDSDNSGTISPEEFLAFFQLGVSFLESENMPAPPPPPVDDLVYKAADLEGVLTAKVLLGKDLRKPSAWFEKEATTGDEEDEGVQASKAPTSRRILQPFDPEESKKKWFAEVDWKSPDVKKRPDVRKGEVKTASKEGESHAEDDKLAPLSSPMKSRDRGDNRSVASHFTATTQAQEEGKKSGIRLHSDKELVAAEINRAIALQTLKKSRAKSETDAGSAESTGTLRKMERSKSKERRSILDDDNAMSFLNRDVRKVSKWHDLSVPSSMPPLDDDRAIQLMGHKDLWDELIERVVTICECRSPSAKPALDAFNAVKALGPAPSRDVLGKLVALPRAKDAVPSGVATPVPAGQGPPKPIKRGTAPTPKNLKAVPGTASVTTGRALNATETRSTVNAAVAKIKEVENERYCEVYRRLVRVDMLTSNELDGDRARHLSNAASTAVSTSYLMAFASRLFDKFDKNLNGLISLDEFQQSLREMNIDVSDEDTTTLFNRFETRQQDGTIDWNEFLDFFNTHIVGDQSHSSYAASTGASLNQDLSPGRSMSTMLRDILLKLAPILASMRKNKCKTADEYLKVTRSMSAKVQGEVPAPVEAGNQKDDDFLVPDNAIFHHLNNSQVSRNVGVLRQLGIHITEREMKRLNRVFSRSASKLMRFLRIFTQPNMTLAEVVDHVDKIVVAGLEGRVAGYLESGSLTSKGISKLWALISGGDKSLRFDDITSLVRDVLVDSILSRDKDSALAASNQASPRQAAPKASQGTSGDSSDSEEDEADLIETFRGVEVRVLSRMVADYMAESPWNQQANVRSQSVCYSAFEAYMRRGHVNNIEMKLKYLLQLELSIAGPSVYALVHVYLNKNKDNAVIIINEPLKGDVYTYEVSEPMGFLPGPIELREHFKKRAAEEASKGSQYSFYKWMVENGCKDLSSLLYSPEETPVEDAAISALVSRLKIVRSLDLNKENMVVMGEDPRFVSQLNKLLSAKPSLPFFSTCNDLSVYFEVDGNGHDGTSGIRLAVFGAIRANKPLHNFLTNVIANLRVILTCYNSGVRISLSWTEMVAHLTGYRNPFVTVELKPKFLQPHEYIWFPDESRTVFDGTEDEDPLAVQRSEVVMDGSSHPKFNSCFNIRFRPPKLTMCKLLCTEIHKIMIGTDWKYVILMVREAKRSSREGLPGDGNGSSDEVESEEIASGGNVNAVFDTFRFITIYDPRSATDYQCGVKPECKLGQILRDTHTEMDGVDSSKLSIEQFMAYVNDAIDKNMILLGPAITPRLIVTVYNQRGKRDEVLGSCEMSISGVLSGSGVGKNQWVTLTHTTDTAEKSDAQVSAGEVQVDMSFRKMSDINAEKEAEKTRLERKKKSNSKADRGQTSASISSNMLSPRVERVGADPGQVPHASSPHTVADEENLEKFTRLEASLQALEKEKKVEEQARAEAERALKAENEKSSRMQGQIEALQKQLESTSVEEPKTDDGNAAPAMVVNRDAAVEEAERLRSSVAEMEASLSSKDMALEEVRASTKKAEEERLKAEELAVEKDRALQEQLKLVAALKADLEKAKSTPASGPVSTASSKAGTKNKNMVETGAAGPDPAPALAARKDDPLPKIKEGTDKSMIMSGQSVEKIQASRAKTPEAAGSTAPTTPLRKSGSDSVAVSEGVPSPSRKINWEEVDLPTGWDRRMDPRTGMAYYVDHVNKKTQWKHPLYVKK